MAKSITGLFVGMGAALALSACAQAPPPPTAAAAPVVDQAAEAAKAQLAQADQNKAIAQQLFSVSMADRAKLLATLESPDYVDHNPTFALFDKLNNVSGSAGIQLLFATRQKLNPNGMARGPATKGPQPPAGNALFQVVASADSFTVIHEQYRPDPSAAGQFYPVFTFDAFKVANGKLTEHWDGATLPTPLPIFLRVPADKLHYPKPGKASARHARAD